jgi:hypothetical protein
MCNVVVLYGQNYCAFILYNYLKNKNNFSGKSISREKKITYSAEKKLICKKSALSINSFFFNISKFSLIIVLGRLILNACNAQKPLSACKKKKKKVKIAVIFC